MTETERTAGNHALIAECRECSIGIDSGTGTTKAFKTGRHCIKRKILGSGRVMVMRLCGSCGMLDECRQQQCSTNNKTPGYSAFA